MVVVVVVGVVGGAMRNAWNSFSVRNGAMGSDAVRCGAVRGGLLTTCSAL